MRKSRVRKKEHSFRQSERGGQRKGPREVTSEEPSGVGNSKRPAGEDWGRGNASRTVKKRRGKPGCNAEGHSQVTAPGKEQTGKTMLSKRGRGEEKQED